MADEPFDKLVGDNLVVNNTLGIGTTEPAAQLHVVSSEQISSKVFVASINGSLLQVTAGPNSASIGTATSHALNINTNGLPRIQISSEGNIGIGTVPITDVFLSVNGTLKATAFKGDGSQLTGKVSTSGDTMTGPLTIQSNLSVSGNVGVGTLSATDAKLTVNGTVKATVFQGDGSQLIGKVNTAGDIMTGPLTVQANLCVSGDIGIGTTNPVSNLSIFSTTPNQSEGMIHLRVTNPFSGSQRLLTGTKRNSTNNARLDWTFGLSSGDTPGLEISRVFRPDGGRPSSVMPLHLAWDGNVGIGTPDPKAKLHVVGDLLGAAKGSGGEALRIAVGQTPVGATNWVQYGTDGIYVDIDTSTAGFSSVLAYFTSIGGSGHHWMTQGATSIYNQTATSFRVHVFQPGIIAAKAAKEWYWHINWIAIGN